MTLLTVILHCDLDCFYAQVERERLKLRRDACVAVVQWSMALAVSYSARKYGINRGSSIEDIRRLAGDAVTIVPVETIAGPLAENIPNQTPNSTIEPHADVQSTEKVSLARYRKASSDVFAAISDALSGYNAKIERASIDEAYIDVTAEVERRQRTAAEGRQWPADTVVVGDKLDLQSATDARLAHGADIAAEIRRQVLERCNYTMSAGISVNKLLSKFASGRNKPNRQTILPMTAVPDLMKDVPLRKLRGLGGKLGREVEALGHTTAGEATFLTMETLVKKLKRWKDADFVYKSVRGIDETEVTERDATKSILAAKNFKGEKSLDTVKLRWLPLLASEVVERMDFDAEINKRDATTLTVSFRVRPLEKKHGMVSASRSVPMPPAHTKQRAVTIISAALSVLTNVLYKEKQFSFPINFIGLTATNFRSRANEMESINTYFTAVAESDMKVTNKCENVLLRDIDRKKAYQKRLQERADRELALRLHREESRVVTKPKKKQKTVPAGPVRTTKQKASTSSRSLTLDAFFKSNVDHARK